MKYIFYADVFFVINLGMDYFLLCTVGKLRKKRITTSYFWGALLGAALLTVLVIFPLPGRMLQSVVLYCLISALMCLVAFGRMRRKEFLETWGCLYVCAFAFGGIMNALYYYTNIPFVLKRVLSGKYVRGWNGVIFLLAAGTSYFVISRCISVMQVRMGRTGVPEDILTAIITHRGNQIRLQALYDSGNSLTEPISGRPVHIIDLDAAEHILKGGQETEEKIRVIPFHSLGKKTGVLTAFECDDLEIIVKGENITLGPVFLGIYRGELSAKRKYKMILNRSINKWL